MSWVAYIDPELAQPGLTEAAAQGRGRSIRILCNLWALRLLRPIADEYSVRRLLARAQAR
jgi:hypothetical protein